jgi:hypothetical protein
MIRITTLHRMANGCATSRAALSCPNPDEAQVPRAMVVLLRHLFGLIASAA